MSVQTDIHIIPATGYFFVGYLLFICMYEVGYLANDSYGLKNDPTPRQRLTINFKFFFVLIFVLLRIMLFLGITVWFDFIANPLFWISYISLSIVIVLHNTLRRVELKFFTFIQLSLLRFSLPVFSVLLIFDRPADILVTFLTGLMLFTYPRVMTYMDAKGRLSIPERKGTDFLLLCHLTTLPFLFLVSAASQTLAPIYAWLWMFFAQVVFVAVNRFGFLRWFKAQFEAKKN